MSASNDKYGFLARGIRRDLTEKGWVPLRYWVIWLSSLVVAIARVLRAADADLDGAAGGGVAQRPATSTPVTAGSSR